MKIRDLLKEAGTSGGTTSGAVPSLANPGGKNPSEVGTFFGGSFERNSTAKTKKNKVIKRQQ